MDGPVAFVGFGEAAMAFANAAPPARAGLVRGFDVKTDQAATRAAKLDEFRACGVEPALSLNGALEAASVVLSLVTADQALVVARSASGSLERKALYLDMNSIAPATKQAAAEAVEAGGGRYVDVAIMAPVYPKRLAVPLLVSGPHSDGGVAALRALGFTNVRGVAGPVGAASSIKMIRSVMVKGMEALAAECMLAAYEADVVDEVIASLDASETHTGWGERINYGLDRMLVHGLRRAAEMEEVVKTLQALGTGSVMAEGARCQQRALGRLGGSPPPRDLAAKLALIIEKKKAQA